MWRASLIFLGSHLSSLDDLGVIHDVAVSSGRGVFHDGRVWMFAISMLMETGAEHSGHLTNVFPVTVTTFCTPFHPTLFLLLGFVFGADQQGPCGVERFVVRWYAVRPKWSL